jgi:hypothetical protein
MMTPYRSLSDEAVGESDAFRLGTGMREGDKTPLLRSLLLKLGYSLIVLVREK